MLFGHRVLLFYDRKQNIFGQLKGFKYQKHIAHVCQWHFIVYEFY